MKSLLLLLFLFGSTFCDTPANCTYDEIKGVWLFSESSRTFDQNVDCNNSPAPTERLTRIELLFPNVAIDSYGNKGHWTLIYNQGFEVTINYRKYFGYSYFEKTVKTFTSYCDRVAPGYSHDILGHNWSCFTGRKTTTVQSKTVQRNNVLLSKQRKFKNDHNLIKEINVKQTSWKAKAYEHFEKYTHHEIFRILGGSKSKFVKPNKINVMTKELEQQVSDLPLEFDWRDVQGINYVSPVRNQKSCGSCYAFSSVGMIEARLRVQTNNSEQPILSPQDIVSCSKYSQGCDGGFPYLIAGKYGQDYGLVSEECAPYKGKNSECYNRNCTKVYTAKYDYVGGFYGACNEDLMKLELVKNGPLSVAFEVYDDFMVYKGGIYHHTGLKNGFNPFEITNHAVLLVGYGIEQETGEKYWIVKNSWGTDWGENGYFRIRRGNDECSIESIAVKATPIP